VTFRIGQNDVESLGKYYQPTFEGDDLLRVPNYNTIVRTLVGGVPTQPFSMATLPPLGNPNPRLFDALKQLSAAKYGRPKASIEKEVFGRFKTAAAKAPAPAAPFAATASPFSAPAPSAAPASGGGSFLDEWLNKRKNGTPQPTVGPTVAPPPPPRPAPVPVPAAPEPHVNRAISGHTSAPANTVPGTDAELDMEDAADVPVVASAASTHFQESKAAPQPRVSDSGPVQGTNNISSDTLSKTEIDGIADQLRQRLDDAKLEETAKPLFLHAKAPTSEQQQPTKDDTIYIDADGSFRQTVE
jgi:hypothetical protein